MVATKTATATGDVVPQQGLYSRRLWQPDHETLVAGDSDASPPHGDLSLHRFFRPLDRDASLDTVRGLLYRGEITKALAEADRALRGGSNIAELHFERAEAHRSLEHWGPAVADYSAAIALDEKNLTCYLRRATLLRQLGRYEEASRDREGALAMLSGSQREVLRGDLVFEDAMTALRSADPMERPKTETMPGRFGWLQKIRIRLRAQPAELQPTKEQPSPIEELERAHDIFRSTLADLPDDAGLLSRCIMVAMATHQTETAADYAERGLAQFPADLELIIQHASVMHALHRWDEALTSYDRALKQLPGREDLRAKRATALLHLSASKEGRFKPVPPSRWNARARRLLAEGDICAAAGNQARASCTFERALAEHLNDVDILMRCAVSAARLGNREASAQFADKAVALASGHPVIVYQHVSVMQALGIWDRALVDYNELIAVSPDRGDLYEGRAAVFDCLGQTAEAEADRGQSKALAATGEPG